MPDDRAGGAIDGRLAGGRSCSAPAGRCRRRSRRTRAAGLVPSRPQEFSLLLYITHSFTCNLARAGVRGDSFSVSFRTHVVSTPRRRQLAFRARPVIKLPLTDRNHSLAAFLSGSTPSAIFTGAGFLPSALSVSASLFDTAPPAASMPWPWPYKLSGAFLQQPPCCAPWQFGLVRVTRRLHVPQHHRTLCDWCRLSSIRMAGPQKNSAGSSLPSAFHAR